MAWRNDPPRVWSSYSRASKKARENAAPDAEYQELKGHRLPRAETRLVRAYDSLLKLEEKILKERG